MIESITKYFEDLRQEYILAFEQFESCKRFEKKPWIKDGLGKGEIGILRGDIFEKAAINYSFVASDNFPMHDAKGPYIATGVSLITHMQNPYMPTVHFNVRFIQLQDRYWFGGGFDMTPMGFENDEDTSYFLQTAKKNLDLFNPCLFPDFHYQAKNYFFIPHWKKERGIGGIFFDHYSTNDLEKDFEMIKKISSSFLPSIIPIYKKNKDRSFTKEDKDLQNRLRAHYVEFNLLYDRGTKFGFQSGGNPEAILCSMPPVATW